MLGNCPSRVPHVLNVVMMGTLSEIAPCTDSLITLTVRITYLINHAGRDPGDMDYGNMTGKDSQKSIQKLPAN